MSKGTLLSINGPMVFIQSLMVEIVVPLFEVHTTEILISFPVYIPGKCYTNIT